MGGVLDQMRPFVFAYGDECNGDGIRVVCLKKPYLTIGARYLNDPMIGGSLGRRWRRGLDVISG